METLILLLSAVIAIFVAVPLIVRMAQKGFALLPRLYVAVFACSILLLGQTAITGNRPLGYFPEVVISVFVALGLTVALALANKDPDRKLASFRSLF